MILYSDGMENKDSLLWHDMTLTLCTRVTKYRVVRDLNLPNASLCVLNHLNVSSISMREVQIKHGILQLAERVHE